MATKRKVDIRTPRGRLEILDMVPRERTLLQNARNVGRQPTEVQQEQDKVLNVDKGLNMPEAVGG